MSRFPSVGGSRQSYTYVKDGYPADAKEGESLYHISEDAAYVYTGASWVEQTVTSHSQLSGVGESDHHNRYTDSEAASSAPVQSVNGQTGYVSVEPGGEVKPVSRTVWNVTSNANDTHYQSTYISETTAYAISVSGGNTRSLTSLEGYYNGNQVFSNGGSGSSGSLLNPLGKIDELRLQIYQNNEGNSWQIDITTLEV